MGMVYPVKAHQEPNKAHDTYGSQTQQSGTSQTVFGYTGEETDSNGLVNLRARYYNPAIGQFFSADSSEGNAGKPLSLHRYAYVQGNIINRHDPSGHGCEEFPEDCGGNLVLINGGGPGNFDLIGITSQGWTEKIPWDGQFTAAQVVPLENGQLPAGYSKAALITIQAREIIVAYNGEPEIADTIAGVLNPYFPDAKADIPDISNLDIYSHLSSSGVQPQVNLGDQTPAPWQYDTCPRNDQNQKRCRPFEAFLWWTALDPRSILGNINSNDERTRKAYQYQYSITHNYLERHAIGGGAEQWVDGLRAQDCFLIDTKYSDHPSSSPYLPDSAFPADIPKTRLEKEFQSYAAIINDPSTPVVGLEIFTNRIGAVSYFYALMARYGINPLSGAGRVTLTP